MRLQKNSFKVPSVPSSGEGDTSGMFGRDAITLLLGLFFLSAEASFPSASAGSTLTRHQQPTREESPR